MSGLIVPVDVTAYCIGRADANKPARSPVSFAGATTDYSRQTGGSAPDAFLGINVTRDADQSPLWPLETGVHLHWAMPDALTRADTTSGRMTFPPLPNRWLVTRIAGHAESARHWIVESDTLSTASPFGKRKPAPTVPVAAAQDFRYLGGRKDFSAAWQEPRGARKHWRA